MKEASSLSGYVLSIVALVFSFVSPFAGFILGIVGLTKTNKKKDSLAKKGKVMSIVAIIISLILITIAILISSGAIQLPNVPGY